MCKILKNKGHSFRLESKSKITKNIELQGKLSTESHKANGKIKR